MIPDGSRAAFAATVVANLFPLVGVFGLGWNAETLVFVYTAELLVAVLSAGLKALFAQQPPNYDRLENAHGESLLDEREGKTKTGPDSLGRRLGCIELVDPLPPVYPRAVPSLSSWVGITLLFATILFGFLAGIVEPLEAVTDPAVAASAVSLAVSHVAVIDRQYFRERGYETATPESVFAVPVQQAVVVAAVLLLANTRLNTTTFLIVIVAVKTLVDWGGYRDDGLFGWFTQPRVDRTCREVNSPEEPVTTTVCPNQHTVLLAGVTRAVTRTLTLSPVLLAVWLALAFLVSASVNWLAVTLVVFGLVPLVIVVLETVEYSLTHGWMVYQRRGETLVAHDRLTDTPQWTATVGEFQSAKLHDRQFADRVFDTRTLAVTPIGADRERTLAHVQSATQAVDAFTLPLVETDYDPFEWRVGSTVLLAAVIAVGVQVALVVTPAGPQGVWVALPFSLPATVRLAQKLWAAAY